MSEEADRRRARWAIAFLIGLATVTAAGFSWRAAQIGSTAAFDDRQSISQTVAVQQAAVERTITVAGDAREYARYRADYAVAARLDAEAARLAAAGAHDLAAVSHAEAAALREGATRRAATAGVFGSFTISETCCGPAPGPAASIRPPATAPWRPSSQPSSTRWAPSIPTAGRPMPWPSGCA